MINARYDTGIIEMINISETSKAVSWQKFQNANYLIVDHTCLYITPKLFSFLVISIF